jgi:hypothetical protein
MNPETVAHVMPVERSIDPGTVDRFEAFLHTIERNIRVAEVPSPTSHRLRPFPE